MTTSSNNDVSGEKICGDAPILIGAHESSPTAATPASATASVEDGSTKPLALVTDTGDAASPVNAIQVESDKVDEKSSGCAPEISDAEAVEHPPSPEPPQREGETPTTRAATDEEYIKAADNIAIATTQVNADAASDSKRETINPGPGSTTLTSDEAQPKQKGTCNNAPKGKTIDPSFEDDAVKFNVALESLETMRKLNLEVEFSSSSLAFPVHHDKCTYCQREALHKFITDPPKPPEANAVASPISERGINIGKVKLDGSRLRKFRSNVGVFFKQVENHRAMTQSSPPSLASRRTSMESTDSIGSDSTTSNNGNASTDNNRANSRLNLLKKQPRACLTCGHPTCSKHSSSTFFKNHIPICQQCAYLFELDFLVDVITSSASDPKECQRKVDHLVDCYDRAKLLLVFAAKYADETAAALDTGAARSNKLGAGSSATGIVSGVAGVVGCGALLFPPVAAVGVPLLVASLVFGGGATAVQTGDAAAKFFSEPNRLAEKMVALHGMVLSLLRITEVLSYALLKNVNVNYSVEGFSEEDQKEVGEGDDGAGDESRRQREALAKEIHELLTKHGVSTTQAGVGGLQSAVVGGIVATEVVAAGAVATAETAASLSAGAGAAAARGAGVVGRNARYVGRVGTTAASGARFIPIAGGLLSAACIVVEGRELKKTLAKIGEGNPCEKAERIRSIKEDAGMLPDSSLIAAECRRVFELARRQETTRRAASAESEGGKRYPQEKGENLTLDNVDAGDIADMISVMEASTAIDGMKDNTTETEEARANVFLGTTKS